MIIRQEHPGDYNAILRLTYEAFLTLDYPGRRRVDEHYLIYLLQNSRFVIPELCFVAELDGQVIGHILYTKSEVVRPNGEIIETITFGPLSVLPERHKQGIGSTLVRHSIEKAKEMGFGAVLITGVPGYYPKLGFKRARDYGLTLTDGTSEDSFMAYELKPGYLIGGGTLRFLPPEFEQSEKDDAGFEAFHRRFMAEDYHLELAKNIKVIGKDELRQALDLVNTVFSEFVAVDYSEQGRKTFSDYLKNKYDEVSADLLSGHKKIWGYYIGEKIVGVIATRNITHIALMFVDKEYHKKGIARQLFQTVRKEIKAHSDAGAITVNSSPYAVKIYERMGFVMTGDVQEKDGIIFIPMECKI